MKEISYLNIKHNNGTKSSFQNSLYKPNRETMIISLCASRQLKSVCFPAPPALPITNIW